MVDLFQPDHLHLGERQDELPPIHSRPPTRNEFAINIPDLLMEPGQCAVQRAPEPSHHYGHYVQNSIVDTPTPTRDEFVIDIDNLPTYPEACAVRKQTQPVIDTGLEGGASTDPPESPDSTAEPRYRKPNVYTPASKNGQVGIGMQNLPQAPQAPQLAVSRGSSPPPAYEDIDLEQQTRTSSGNTNSVKKKKKKKKEKSKCQPHAPAPPTSSFPIEPQEQDKLIGNKRQNRSPSAAAS
ncbi:hypothetical protein BJY01DRAFT_254766 [Aspergillus pseudoustus]|uniref:Uncharacterized protein n=1 Tax=Aspergillus pseudoustus TaxID=1810923 RepID=A0ABR4IS82_9EURO